MIERLPEPARKPAMHPSWPEWDQAALALPSAEQSYLRPCFGTTVGDGEHRIEVSDLVSRRGLVEQGERHAIHPVHHAVHCRVHLDLALSFHNHKEMQVNKTRHSDAEWPGVGLERPRFHCHEMRGGRSSPTMEVARWVMWSSPCNFTALHVTAGFTPHQLASAYQRARLLNCESGKSTRPRSGKRRERPHPWYARCVKVSWGRSRLASLGCAMSSAPRAIASFRSSEVKKVRISFCTVVCANFRTLHAIHVIYVKGVDTKASAKSSNVRTTKTGWSDPENFGLSRPKCGTRSLPPCCSHFCTVKKGTRDEANQVRMRTLVRCTCKKGEQLCQF